MFVAFFIRLGKLSFCVILLEDCFERKWLQNRLRADEMEFSSGEIYFKSRDDFRRSIARNTDVKISSNSKGKRRNYLASTVTFQRNAVVLAI